MASEKISHRRALASSTLCVQLFTGTSSMGMVRKSCMIAM